MLHALTPLGKVAEARSTWWRCAALYTAGGLAASVVVGAALAVAGSVAGPAIGTLPEAAILAALGLAAAAREIGALETPLPQRRRATRDVWARRWGHRRASLLWGVDIGSFFTTWLTFAGAWWLVGIALLAGDVTFAAALFAAYWGGRALTIWVAPLFVPDATITPRLVVAWHRLFRPFQLLHGGVVLAGVAILIALAIQA